MKTSLYALFFTALFLYGYSPEASTLYKQALELLKKGELDQAVSLYQQALENDPSILELKDHGLAKLLLHRLEKKSSSLEAGKACFLCGYSEKARIFFEKTLSEFPLDALEYKTAVAYLEKLSMLQQQNFTKADSSLIIPEPVQPSSDNTFSPSLPFTSHPVILPVNQNENFNIQALPVYDNQFQPQQNQSSGFEPGDGMVFFDENTAPPDLIEVSQPQQASFSQPVMPSPAQMAAQLSSTLNMLEQSRMQQQTEAQKAYEEYISWNGVKTSGYGDFINMEKFCKTKYEAEQLKLNDLETQIKNLKLQIQNLSGVTQ